MTRDSSLSEDPRGLILYPVGVELGKLQPATPEHNTETFSLGAPPPADRSMRAEIADWLRTRIRLYFWELPVLTILHTLLYLTLFLLPFFAAYIWRPWETALWAEYIPTLAYEGIAAEIVVDISQFLAKPEALAVGLILTACWFYLLNFIDVFWGIHYGNTRNPGPLVVPTWIQYERRHSNYEKLLRVDGSSLHFGLLSIWYGFNNEALFVRAQGDHAAMIINFSLITDVKVENSAPEGWFGTFDTPPVRIVFEAGRKTTLRIHGSYFEQNGNGSPRAAAFASALRAAIDAKKKRTGPIPSTAP